MNKVKCFLYIFVGGVMFSINQAWGMEEDPAYPFPDETVRLEKLFKKSKRKAYWLVIEQGEHDEASTTNEVEEVKDTDLLVTQSKT